NNHSYTIIGVAEENFRGTVVAFSPDLWVPLAMQEQAMPGKLMTRNASWLQAFGRLKAGVAIEQGQAELVTLAEQLQQAYPDTNRDRGIRLLAASAIPGAVRGPAIGFMSILMAIVGLVLLIACANVAAMFLTRTTARRKEIAIRLAMGATRSRIIRQVLIESLALFLLGGAAGTLFAMWITNLLSSVKLPFDLPVFIDLGLDGRVLGFTLLATLATGVLFGLSPALQASKPDLLPALKSDTPGGGATRSRTRNAFVVAQVAISLVLLVVGGLFLRSLMNAARIEPGFNPEGVQTVGFNLKIQGYDEPRGREFYRQLVEQVSATPGCASASLAFIVPLSGNVMTQGIRIDGIEPPPGLEATEVDCNIIDASYFQTLEIRLQRGR
ncbi:MAG TPA: FtsX-like permease family protein, partial [Burkholderiales bacterium]|nr:FtsX-like permease family protein [Burkholderiales bacterium]